MLAEQGLDTLVVYGHGGFPGPVHYLTEFPARQPTWLIYSTDVPTTLFLHFANHVPTAEAISTVSDVRCYWPSAPSAVAAEVLARVAGRGRIGVVGSHAAIPHGEFELLGRLLSGVELVDVTSTYQAIRWIRSDEELGRFRSSGAIIDEACQLLAEELRPGMTEHDMKGVLHRSFVRRGGAEGIIFISSVDMSAPDRRSPWQFPSGRVTERGHAVITEITINDHGYGGQIHRPFAIGTEPTPLFRDLFEAAEGCFAAVLDVLRDGATADEVRAAARTVEDRELLLFDSVVHGEGGKNPEIGAAGSPHRPESWIFREGQVVIVQPNPVTRDGRAGLQAGCAVRVGRDEAVPIHGYPLEFPVCG